MADILTAKYYIVLAVSFLIGAIPFAYLFVRRLKNIDIRKVGSGNVGATNAARVLGRPMGIFILFLDALKGAIPTLLGTPIVTGLWPWQIEIPAHQIAALSIGIAAFLGHCFNPFLRFKGGKGVATGLGVFLVLAPCATFTTFIVCIIIIVTTRLVSLASITGAILLPFFIVLFSIVGKPAPHIPWALVAITAILGALIILRHRSNIRRLLKGAESKA